jgi:general secretion pathway protein E
MDAEHDYNFANGRRSILRHDPDVILVGEIRDLETAQTAVNAALTGHVVLSTLHTNSAIEAIQRMLSMGVSPYTLAPALRAILAQRLVRTVKAECKIEGANCDPAANDTYDGQMCLPELLMVTEPIRQAILNFDSAANILELAKKEGYKTMREWGTELVKEKRTMQMEIDRVCM